MMMTTIHKLQNRKTRLSFYRKGAVHVSGLTRPCCACDTCKRRYAELCDGGHAEPNPAVWEALLNLAKQGKFQSRTVSNAMTIKQMNYLVQWVVLSALMLTVSHDRGPFSCERILSIDKSKYYFIMAGTMSCIYWGSIATAHPLRLRRL